MDRRKFVRSIAAGLAVVGPRARASSLPRVALVFNNPPSSGIADYPYDKAFARGLRKHGLEDGRNVIVVRRSAEGRYDRLPRLMEELVSVPVDVIVAIGPGVGAARRATRTIPIVAVATDDLVESAAVASLGRPGGNVTGLTGEVGLVEMAPKRLQLLHDMAPAAARVAILGYALRALDAAAASTLESASRALGQTIVWALARTPLDFKAAFATVRNEKADALYVEGQAANFRHVREIVDLATRLRLPSIYEFREGPEHGGLMSYGADLGELFNRAASFVARILKGARPGELAVEQPTKFDLTINAGTAKALGITIPQTLLVRAELIR